MQMRNKKRTMGINKICGKKKPFVVSQSGETIDTLEALREAQRKGFDKLAMTTPDKAAEIIVKGILKNESRILVGPDAWGIDAINRLLGSAYQPLVERFSRKNLYI